MADLEIVPTGDCIGAEVWGVNLSGEITDDVKQTLRDAWYQYLALLFRGQALSPEQYVEAAQIFGKPQPSASRAYFQKTGLKDASDALGVAEISIVSNLDANGQPTEHNDALGSVEVVWHSDNSYIECPPAGSTMYAREIPADGSGRTSFNNQYLVYEDLDDDLKRAIHGRYSKQDATRDSAGVLRPGVTTPERPQNVPGPMHPMVRVHPVTGRKALYLGRRRVWPSQYIDGLDNDASKALLDRLWAHATQEKYQWTHTWQVGDFLVWDNRCAMHYREPVDLTQRRVMWRSQFQGEAVDAAW